MQKYLSSRTPQLSAQSVLAFPAVKRPWSGFVNLATAGTMASRPSSKLVRKSAYSFSRRNIGMSQSSTNTGRTKTFFLRVRGQVQRSILSCTIQTGPMPLTELPATRLILVSLAEFAGSVSRQRLAPRNRSRHEHCVSQDGQRACLRMFVGVGIANKDRHLRRPSGGGWPNFNHL